MLTHTKKHCSMSKRLCARKLNNHQLLPLDTSTECLVFTTKTIAIHQLFFFTFVVRKVFKKKKCKRKYKNVSPTSILRSHRLQPT